MQSIKIDFRKGDALDEMRKIESNSIDSIVTDSPYGFGKEPDPLILLPAWLDHGYLEIKGRGFMGEKWDSFVPQPILWKEAFRILKPGGYLLSFFGTRTYDWGTLAIRLAGFEIRDMITWHYGTGFPKSLDVEKETAKKIGKNDAMLYKGVGTALKPATEPICVARKPLEGTVAENVLKYGTGGLNLDDCKIAFSENEPDKRIGTDSLCGTQANKFFGLKNEKDRVMYNDGRHPANVILDPFSADLFNEQSGILKSGGGVYSRNDTNNILGKSNVTEFEGYGDSGGASRFFYCAKTSPLERNAGCEHLKISVEATHNRFDKCKNCGGYILQSKNRDSKCVCDNPERETEKEAMNHHPTVKPIAVMRWLQRLVTPIGGTTLDMFAGSGTSACSAAFEGFNIIIIEKEPKYFPIIEARTKYWLQVANRDRYHKSLRDSVQTLF